MDFADQTGILPPVHASADVLSAVLSADGIETLAALYDIFSAAQGRDFQITCVICRQPFAERIASLPKVFSKVRIRPGTHPASYVLTTSRAEVPEGTEVPLRVFESRHSQVALLATWCTSPEWKASVGPLLEWLAPRIYQPFLRQEDLLAIFRQMEASLGDEQELRLRRISDSRRILYPNSRKTFESRVCWTDIGFSAAFEDAERRLAHFRTLAFDTCDLSGDRVRQIEPSGTIRKNTHFSIGSSATMLVRTAVETALQRVANDVSLLRDRGRIPHSRVETLAVTFDSRLRFEGDDVARVSEQLRQYQHASISFFSRPRGLSVTVTDRQDGSSFDLVSSGPRQLTIVPHLRTSAGALTRFCNFIYDEIGEATFSEGVAVEADNDQ